MPRDKLTPKQQRFVEEYLVDLNATAAAIRAGYSEKTARQVASQNLSKLNIQAAIAEAKANRSERTGIDADRTLTELGCIAYSDIRKMFTEDGRIKPLAELDPETAAAIASYEIVERNIGDGEVERVHKVKFWDKNSALQKVMQHLGLFEKDNRQQNPFGQLSDEQLLERIAYLSGQLQQSLKT